MHEAEETMSQPMVVEGGCLCGQVRYRIAGPVAPAVYCHCSMCRKATGAPAAVWIFAARKDFRFTGAPPASYASSPRGERLFCPDCGGQIGFAAKTKTDEIALLAGSLDDPDAFPPQSHVMFVNRLSWFHTDDDLPAHDGIRPSAV